MTIHVSISRFRRKSLFVVSMRLLSKIFWNLGSVKSFDHVFIMPVTHIVRKGDSVSDQNFRGLKWEPSYEGEVLILFGMLLPHLKETVLIEEYTDEFPDCKAKIDGEDVGIEFEVDSRNFYDQKHHEDPRLPKCSLIVCWKNPYNDVIKPQGHSIKILELSKVIKEKNLHLIRDGPCPRPEEWNKERFLGKLRKNIGYGERYRWVKDLVEFCDANP